MSQTETSLIGQNHLLLNFDNMKFKKIDIRNKNKKKSKIIRNCFICFSFVKV